MTEAPKFVDEIFEEIRQQKLLIKAAEDERDKRIWSAKLACEKQVSDAQTIIAGLSARLEGFFKENPPETGKSLNFESGYIGYQKQRPTFFIGGKPVTNDNPALIELARGLDLVKTKETANWEELKKRIEVDGDTVYLRDTGEVLSQLRAETPPDKFIVRI